MKRERASERERERETCLYVTAATTYLAVIVAII